MTRTSAPLDLESIRRLSDVVNRYYTDDRRVNVTVAEAGAILLAREVPALLDALGGFMTTEPNAESVRRAVERISSTQARCGTKLMQVPADFIWPGARFEAGDVDVEFLVREVLHAAQNDRAEAP